MATFGSPFRSGSLSSVIFAGLLTLVMTVLYLQDAERDTGVLLLVFVGLGVTIRYYFKYRKLQFQQGRELIGDLD